MFRCYHRYDHCEILNFCGLIVFFCCCHLVNPCDSAPCRNGGRYVNEINRERFLICFVLVAQRSVIHFNVNVLQVIKEQHVKYHHVIYRILICERKYCLDFSQLLFKSMFKWWNVSSLTVFFRCSKILFRFY